MANKTIWNKSKIKYLKENYKTLSFAKIATELGCHRDTVVRKANMMGLFKNHPTAEREAANEYIKNNYGKISRREMAEHLGISIEPLWVRARYLGVSEKQDKGTLCWDCAHATNKHWLCPWSASLKPVKGWEADEITWGNREKSFKVKNCPLFKEG